MGGWERYFSNRKTLSFRPRQTKPSSVVLLHCLSCTHPPESMSISLIRITKSSKIQGQIECLCDRTWGFTWKCNVKDWKKVAYKSNTLSWMASQGPATCPSSWYVGRQAVSSMNSTEDPLCMGHCSHKGIHTIGKRSLPNPHPESWGTYKQDENHKQMQIHSSAPTVHTDIINDGETETL